MKKYALIALAFAVSLSVPSGASAACTSLTKDLSQGANDSKMGGEVLKLQQYLQFAGYLSAAPNGNFGPATLAAVKAFQSANKIPATGMVGSITRFAIQTKSCVTTSQSSSQVSSTPISQQQQIVYETTVTVAPKRVIAPGSNERLIVGANYLVVWEQSASNQSVILEDKDGVAQGFLTSSLAGIANFSWRVGTVYSTRIGADTVVSPGSYRIRVSSAGVPDQVSSYFNIETPPLVVTSIAPKQAVADAASSVVLYGEGFIGSVGVYLDDRWGPAVNKLYVSPDGKVLVLSFPRSTPVGTHWIVLDNGFGTNITAGSVTVTSSSN